MFRSAVTSVIALFLVSFGVSAQRAMLSTAELARVPVLELPHQNNDSLLVHELAARRRGRAEIFAVSVPVDLRPAESGRWTEIGTDSLSWRLRIHSPGAKSLNLGFSRFAVPEGGRLYLSNGEARYGPFSAADDDDHAEFWSPVLAGDELLVELEIPRAARDAADLRISSVNHDYEGVLELLSGPCHLDVVCGAADGYPQVEKYRDVIRSVASFTLQGRERCTGFLVNNTNRDGRPLFMTANHCGVDERNAASLVTYWNFENSTCRTPGSEESGNAGDGQAYLFNTGARVLANNSATDMTLTELDEPVPAEVNAYFAGWSAERGVPTGEVAIIHHPSLDEKRISLSEQPVVLANISGEPAENGNFLRVPYWDIGSTETGSSGAPLFDSDARLRGQLFGGRASCGNDAEDIFGFFAESYDGGSTPGARLSDWLDPCGTGVLTLDGLDASTLGYALVTSTSCQTTCTGQAVVYELHLGSDFPSGTELTVMGHDLLEVRAPARADGGNTFMVTVNPAGAAAGNFSVGIVAAGGDLRDTAILSIELITQVPSATVLLEPLDRDGDIDPFLLLRWTEQTGAEAYDLQLSLEEDFGARAVDLQHLAGTEYAPEFPLIGGVEYHWRVRARNACGAGAWSEPRTFVTADRSCLLKASGVLPVPIDASRIHEDTVTLDLTESIDLSFIEVIVGVEHSFIGDLGIRLVSPAGIEVELLKPILGGACSATDLYVIFSEDAGRTAEAFGGECNDGQADNYVRVQPAGDFGKFAGGSSRGTWKLIVRDVAAEDGGAVTDFRLRICEERADDRDLGVEVISNPLVACSNEGGTARLQLGTDYTDDLLLRVEAGGRLLDNYTFQLNDDHTLDVRFSAWTLAPTGTEELSMIVIAADGTERRAVSTLTVLPLPEAVATFPGITGGDSYVFTWRYSEVSDDYLLQISSTESFSDTLLEVGTLNRRLQIPASSLPEDFYWRVVGRNGCGEFPGVPRNILQDITSSSHDPVAAYDISIYPNPARGSVSIELSGDWTAEELQITLHGATGQRVADWPGLRAPSVQLNLQTIPPGVYYLRVSGRHGGVTRRLLLLR